MHRVILSACLYLLLLTSCDAKLSTKNNSKNRCSNADNLKLIRGGSDSLDWRYFLAGGLCAATSHGITTPIGQSISYLNFFLII